MDYTQCSEYLGQFLNPSNVKEVSAENVTVLSYSLTASEQLAALTKGKISFDMPFHGMWFGYVNWNPYFVGIHLLEKELQSQIYSNYPQLISQTLRIDNLQENVFSLQSETEVMRFFLLTEFL